MNSVAKTLKWKNQRKADTVLNEACDASVDISVRYFFDGHDLNHDFMSNAVWRTINDELCRENDDLNF